MTGKRPETGDQKYEWVRYPLPKGISPIGRVFEAGEIRNAVGSGRRMSPRNYPGYAIVYLTRLTGSGYYEDFSGFKRTLREGDCILVHPERTHSYGPDDGATWSEIYVSFDGPVFDELDRGGLIHKDRPPVFSPGDGDLSERLRRCIFDTTGRPLSMTVATGRLVAELTVLAELRDFESVTGRESWVKRAAIALEREGATVAEVCKIFAAESGASPDAVRKSFRRATGDSMENHRLRARLAAAVTLVQAGDEPFKSIAHRLGFSHEQHFSRTLSRSTGFTPGELRSRGRFARSGPTKT